MSNLDKVPFIDATYQILIHLAKWFQKRRFLMYQPIRNQNRPWKSCLFHDLDGRRTANDDKSSHFLWPGELKIFSVDMSYFATFNTRSSLFQGMEIKHSLILWMISDIFQLWKDYVKTKNETLLLKGVTSPCYLINVINWNIIVLLLQ